MSTRPPASRTTSAFFVQSILSFAVAMVATIYAVAHIPGNGWMRGLLLLGILYVVTSTFTLAKCIRDQQEASSVISRVDQVRLERLLAEHDPFGAARRDGLGPPVAAPRPDSLLPPSALAPRP